MQGRRESEIILYQCDQNNVAEVAAKYINSSSSDSNSNIYSSSSSGSNSNSSRSGNRSCTGKGLYILRKNFVTYTNFVGKLTNTIIECQDYTHKLHSALEWREIRLQTIAVDDQILLKR